MNTATDPILQLRELDADQSPPDPQAQARARAAMFAARRRPPVRQTVAVAAVAVTLLAVVLTATLLDNQQSAQAAVGDLARTAAAQEPVLIGRGDWITTRYVTKRSWTQDLTQQKVDRLSARTAATMAAANASGHYMRANGKPLPAEELAKIARVNARRQATIRAGLKIDSLPTTHVVAWNTSAYTSTRDANGYGGGGGGNNSIDYQSPEQAQAGKILQRAGIGGRAADPVDFGGSEIADLPTRAVSDESDVASLSTSAVPMHDQLAAWKQSGGLPGDVKKGSPLDIFVKATGVVGSPSATPAQRAAAIQTIVALPGVSVDTAARDARGRTGLGMSIEIAGGTMQIAFDREDSRLLGMQVKITNPATFSGDSYAGSGKDRVRVIPPFDSATIAVSYDPVKITHGDPPCTPESCMAKPNETLESMQRRMKAAARSR